MIGFDLHSTWFNMAFGLPKTNKENSGTSAITKPAYISVSLPKSDVQASSHDASDSILKPEVFPKSLLGYVERALARCKDDTQKEASQSVLKEILIKATADGTITRDWDSEPLFPMPSTDVVKNLLASPPFSSLSKSKISPNRRSKSRWEPVLEEKSADEVESVTPSSVKYGSLSHFSGSDEKPEVFPKSLLSYVERALARCKDDTQKEASQSVLKAILIKANARDWDIEPLFPMPITDVA